MLSELRITASSHTLPAFTVYHTTQYTVHTLSFQLIILWMMHWRFASSAAIFKSCHSLWFMIAGRQCKRLPLHQCRTQIVYSVYMYRTVLWCRQCNHVFSLYLLAHAKNHILSALASAQRHLNFPQIIFAGIYSLICESHTRRHSAQGCHTFHVLFGLCINSVVFVEIGSNRDANT